MYTFIVIYLVLALSVTALLLKALVVAKLSDIKNEERSGHPL